MKTKHEARMVEIEVEHKAHITELETKGLGTPPTECEARAVELNGCVTTIDTRLVETQNFLDEAMHTQMIMEEIDGLVEVRASLQKNQQKFDELIATTKDLSALEHIIKMKESTKLQVEMQKLLAKEAEYLRTLQPWQE